MRAKTNKLYYIIIFVIPYQQKVIVNMTFHVLLPFTF